MGTPNNPTDTTGFKTVNVNDLLIDLKSLVGNWDDCIFVSLIHNNKTFFTMTVLSILKEKFVGTTMKLYRSNNGEWHTRDINSGKGGWYRCEVVDVELVVEYGGRTYYNYVCESIMFDGIIKIELPLD
jgi:hypothetical protein